MDGLTFLLYAAYAAALVGVVLFCWGMWSGRSRGRARCPRCWYDMRGSADGDLPLTCPECGRVIKARGELHKARRRWVMVCAGVVLICVAGYSRSVRYRVGEIGESWRDAWVPSSVLLVMLASGGADAPPNLAMRMLPVDDMRPNVRDMWGWQDWVACRTAARLILRESDARQKRALLLIVVASRYLDKTVATTCLRMWDDPDQLLREHARESVGALDDAALAHVPSERLGDLLIDLFEPLPQTQGSRHVVLRELVRRGDVAQVQRVLADYDDRSSPDKLNDYLSYALVTALRRVRGEPDPIHVQVVDPPTSCAAGTLPVLTIRVENRDIERRTLRVAWGSSDENWRSTILRVRAKPVVGGKVVDELIAPQMTMDGDQIKLAFGETREMTLDMACHIRPLEPGDYSVVVDYAADDDYALSWMEMDRRLFVSSQAFELRVE